MNKAALTPGRLLAVLVFALSCFGLLLFLWLAFGGPIPLKPQGYRIQAAFGDAPTLAEQAEVRVAGVPIGKVVRKERAPEGNRSLATLEIDSRYAPIRSDARAVLRQKTLLGETYVEMTLGTKGAAFLPEGARLANAQVADAVEFDELLRIFGPETRRDFRRWQETLADASRGRAQDFNDALGNLPEFAEAAQGLVDVLARRRAALGSLVRNTGATFEAITRNERALETLIVRTDDVFGTLGARRDALAETFRVLPTFQREARATMRRLATFSQATEPLIRDLEPVLEDAQPTLSSLGELAPDAERLFEDLDPLIRAGRTGFPALARVLRGLDPTLAALRPFLLQLNPILEYLELYQTTVSDFLNVGPSALALKVAAPPGSGTNGHALPQLLVTGDQSFAEQERSRTNRGNAYFRPGWLDFREYRDPARRILPNFDCKHLGGPKPPAEDEGFPGCFVQGPIEFQNRLQRFPQVRAGRR